MFQSPVPPSFLLGQRFLPRINFVMPRQDYTDGSIQA